ncbi:MAG TPA: RNA pseudouridine synthase [Verrucomicrobiota bacterium]|jgi:RluA family pseudouridine synthase|nr:RNA pseudouridine synthase [Verrucomicrobiota bacterium]HQL76956.1 RNA pseudouridine synthase [Verrucomicrobiota bacterium]
MAKPDYIELLTGERIPILYEDRSVLAIDKPPGWMLVPFSWQKTGRNLQAALVSSIASKAFWARSRGLKYLRFVHRLDADTSGVLLLAKSPGAVNSFGALFESRRMEKVYLAVVTGMPRTEEWTCRLKLAPDPEAIGRMRVDARHGKEAETRFRVLQSNANMTLIEAHPVTGRTHQIRVHLAQSGHPVVGDALYGAARGTQERTPREKGERLSGAQTPSEAGGENPRERVGKPRRQGMGLGLRAVRLSYVDPFTRRRVDIRAPLEQFVGEYGFDVFKL